MDTIVNVEAVEVVNANVIDTGSRVEVHVPVSVPVHNSMIVKNGVAPSAYVDELCMDNINNFFEAVEAKKKVDIVVESNRLKMDYLSIEDNGSRMDTTPFFRKQMYGKLAPGLVSYGAYLEGEGRIGELNDVVNRELSKIPVGKHNLIRTANNTARAFLSTKYKAIDDTDVFGMMKNRLNMGEFNFMKAHTAMDTTSLKMISKTPFMNLGKRPMYYGYIAQNSEVGMGYMEFLTFLCDGYCMNGVIFAKKTISVLKIKHIGERYERLGVIDMRLDHVDSIEIEGQLQIAMTKALDVPNHGLAEKLEFAYNKKITGKFSMALMALLKKYKLNLDPEALMTYLVPGEETVYGAQAMITRMAQDIPSYAKRLELETVAGNILDDVTNVYNEMQFASVAA